MRKTIQEFFLTMSTGELLYFIVFVLLFSCDFYNTTTFKGLIDISILLSIVKIISIILIFVKSVFVDHFTFKQLFIIGIIVGISAISVILGRKTMLLDFILLGIGSYGVDDKKIIKTYFILGTLFLLITIVSSLSGIIVNYSSVRSGTETIRYSFGVIYSTDFAAHVFFLILAYHYIRERRLNLIDVLIHVLIVILLDYYCDARLSELMIILTLIMFILYDFRRSIYESKFFGLVTNYATVICGFFSVIVTYLYSSSNAFWVTIDNLLFSNRLKIGKKVIDMYGLSLFGQVIKMQGNGYSINEFDTSIGITYLDSSYMQIFMIYGVILFIIMMIAYTFSSRNVFLDNNLKLCIIIVLISFSSIINQYLINIAYNPFVIIFGNYLLSNERINSCFMKIQRRFKYE